jgi:hypothetical protein
LMLLDVAWCCLMLIDAAWSAPWHVFVFAYQVLRKREVFFKFLLTTVRVH